MKKLLILSAILLISGCATKVVGLKKAEDFTFENVKSGRLAIGGVSSAIAVLKEADQNTLSNMLKDRILEERGALSVSPVGYVKKNLGDKAYASVLKEYENLGSVSDEWLPKMRDKLEKHRYVVFARVESDDVSQDRDERAEYNSDGSINNERSTVVSSTTRTVSINVQVLDLYKNQVAWSGTVAKSLSNSRDYKKVEDIGLVKLVKAIKGSESGSPDEKYPFPEAPNTNKVLAAAFTGFAENLPKED